MNINLKRLFEKVSSTKLLSSKKIKKYFQYFLLYLTYYLTKFFVKKSKGISWVIGVDEIAGLIYNLGKVLQPSETVCFYNNKFYNFKYNYSLNLERIKKIKKRDFLRLVYGPVLLGYLANKHTHFWYIWSTGFMLDREWDFKFLKSKNKKIVCMFCGDDIRSPKLTMEFVKEKGLDHFVYYVGLQNSYYLNQEYEEEKKDAACIAEKYADVIFNFKYDQISYLKSEQFVFPYMYDKDKFYRNEEKFRKMEVIKILHAPSNPLVKGTTLVRAAIKRLREEGYKFEYIELQNVPNEVVLEHLRTSHIVLNHFYGFTICVFGIEAMANHCAVLMSADPSIEEGLPEDSKDAWLITKYWQIYDNLKFLLDNPEKIKYYADKGFEFAYRNYTYESVREYIYKILKQKTLLMSKK